MNIEEKVAAKAAAKAKAENTLEIVKNLLEMKLPLEKVAEVCNLTLEEVRKIQKSEPPHV